MTIHCDKCNNTKYRNSTKETVKLIQKSFLDKQIFIRKKKKGIPGKRDGLLLSRQGPGKTAGFERTTIVRDYWSIRFKIRNDR